MNRKSEIDKRQAEYDGKKPAKIKDRLIIALKCKESRMKKEGFWGKLWPALIVGLILNGFTGVITWSLTIASERRAAERKIADVRAEYEVRYKAAGETYVNSLGTLVNKGGDLASNNPGEENLEVAGRAIVGSRNELASRLTSLSGTLDHEIDELEQDIARLKKASRNKANQDKVKKDLLVLREKWPIKSESIKVEIRKLFVELGVVERSARESDNSQAQPSLPTQKVSGDKLPSANKSSIDSSPLISTSPLISASLVVDHAIYSPGQVGVKPQITYKETPRYTPEAHNAGVQGIVIVSAVLRKDGRVTDIQVVRTLGHGLDQEAIKAAHQTKFIPGQKDGKPVNVKMILEYTFTIT